MSLKGRPRTEPVLDRIERMSCPEPNTGCILWTGSLSQGYGRVGITSSKCEYAYRVAYESEHGPTNQKLYHRCGQRCCVNPDHLTTDRPVQKKPKHARLDKEMADLVRKVCAAGESQARVARLLKVSPVTIHNILDGRRYV